MSLRGSLASHNSLSNDHIHRNLRKLKQQTIFTYNKQPTKNVYYDNNPYLLTNNQNPHKQPMGNSRRSSNSKDFTETSSQRSYKVVRAHGLKLAEKPNFTKQKNLHEDIGNKSNHHQRTEQKPSQLQNENKRLKEQNQWLRAQLKALQQDKNRQLQILNNKINQISHLAIDLQKQINQSQLQWNDKLKELQQMQQHRQKSLSS